MCLTNHQSLQQVTDHISCNCIRLKWQSPIPICEKDIKANNWHRLSKVRTSVLTEKNLRCFDEFMQTRKKFNRAEFLIIFSFVIWGHAVFAKPQLAPPNFDLADGSGQAIFVHFKTATYNVSFDVATKTTQVKSVINFENDEVGMPLFDLVDEPSKITIDGVVDDI